jgi:hypothetical protein
VGQKEKVSAPACEITFAAPFGQLADQMGSSTHSISWEHISPLGSHFYRFPDILEFEEARRFKLRDI